MFWVQRQVTLTLKKDTKFSGETANFFNERKPLTIRDNISCSSDIV